MKQQSKNILCPHIKSISKTTLSQLTTLNLSPQCVLNPQYPPYYLCLTCGTSLSLSFHNNLTCVEHHFKTESSHIFYLQVQNGSIWCCLCGNSVQNQIFQFDGDRHNQELTRLVRFKKYIHQIWLNVKSKLNVKESIRLHRGLKNLGNTCYLNSVLQCLFVSKNLKELYQSYDVSQELQKIVTNKKIIPKETQYFFDEIIDKKQSQTWNIVIGKKQKSEKQRSFQKYIINTIKKPTLNIELRNFFDKMSKTENISISFSPIKILKSLGQINSKYLIQEQQDADQLLLTFIDALNQGQRISFLRDRERYNTVQNILGNWKLVPVQNLFGFYLVNEVQCSQCKDTNISMNLTYNISPSLNNPASNSNCNSYTKLNNSNNSSAFSQSTKKDNLMRQNQDKIEHIQQKVKINYLQELRYPTNAIDNPFLQQFFSVQRLNKFNNFYQCNKCKSDLAYRKYYILDEPQILIISLKRFSSSLQKKSVYIQFPEKMNLNGIVLNDLRVEYQLYAMIIHQGRSLQSGHYMAMIKIQEKWWLCSDEKIQLVSWDYAKKQQAYILFYQKISTT